MKEEGEEEEEEEGRSSDTSHVPGHVLTRASCVPSAVSLLLPTPSEPVRFQPVGGWRGWRLAVGGRTWCYFSSFVCARKKGREKGREGEKFY